MSHDRGCYCGREKYEYDECQNLNCTKKNTKKESVLFDRALISVHVNKKYSYRYNDFHIGSITTDEDGKVYTIDDYSSERFIIDEHTDLEEAKNMLFERFERKREEKYKEYLKLKQMFEE